MKGKTSPGAKTQFMYLIYAKQKLCSANICQSYEDLHSVLVKYVDVYNQS